jgi:3',5'-cyclic-AMP phosphodiesterase
MPITLPPLSRRRFLAGSLAAGAGLLLRSPWLGAADAPATDPHRFALLSDLHVAADPAVVARGVNMFNNMKQASAEVLALDPRPAAVIVDGDLAYLKGLAEDYATVVGLLKPVREAGLPVHLTLGNHDDRAKFWQAIPPPPAADRAGARPVEDRQVLTVESPRANWFILDSLDKTNGTPGVLGKKQLDWLAGALDAKADKPALVMVHHDPDDKPKPQGKVTGLTDAAALLEVLRPRKQVKVLFYGHTHDWHLEDRDGLHLVNFPPVAYPFKAGKPSGWVDAHLREDGMTLELRSIDPKHPQHGEKHELKWRA